MEHCCHTDVCKLSGAGKPVRSDGNGFFCDRGQHDPGMGAWMRLFRRDGDFGGALPENA